MRFGIFDHWGRYTEGTKKKEYFLPSISYAMKIIMYCSSFIRYGAQYNLAYLLRSPAVSLLVPSSIPTYLATTLPGVSDSINRNLLQA